ncbi:MAG: outer membrane beta-barrel protein [Bacteroidales bacterium]|nr:outer membrane beta-barrel protein [Bacteroidales bacterium]
MKRITLLLMLLCLTALGFAQEEVAIEQTISQPISYLNIDAGWDVRLMHRDTDTYRLAVIIPERFAGIAAEAQVCNLSGDTLTILENMMLPQGTIIELEGNLNFKAITLFREAKASFDHLSVPQDVETKDYLYLMRKSEANINQLISGGEFLIHLSDESKVSIDTIQGSGKPIIELYNADFQYGTSLLDGEILVKEYKSPTWFYEKKNPKVIKTEIVDGQPVTKECYKTWSQDLAFNAGIGFRKYQNPVDFNSPFTNNGVLTVSWGMLTSFRFGDRWTLSTGLRYNFNRYYMVHQLKLNENGLETIDGQTPIQQNQLTNGYLGIPVELYFHFAEPLKSSLSLDAFFGRRLHGTLDTRSHENNYKGWTGENAPLLFNPWKLEVGLSINTGLIGFVHGFRVYTNLLPEYNKAVTTEKFRSIGVEIKF